VQRIWRRNERRMCVPTGLVRCFHMMLPEQLIIRERATLRASQDGDSVDLELRLPLIRLRTCSVRNGPPFGRCPEDEDTSPQRPLRHPLTRPRGHPGSNRESSEEPYAPPVISLLQDAQRTRQNIRSLSFLNLRSTNVEGVCPLRSSFSLAKSCGQTPQGQRD